MIEAIEWLDLPPMPQWFIDMIKAEAESRRNGAGVPSFCRGADNERSSL